MGRQVSIGTASGVLKSIASGTPSLPALWNVLGGPVQGIHDELLRRNADQSLAGFFAYVGPIRPRSPYDW